MISFETIYQVPMTEFEYMWYILSNYLIFMLIPVALGLAAAWIIWEFKFTPKEAKKIRAASRRHKPIAILESDDGYVDFEVLNERGYEGYAMTSTKPKKKWIGFFGRNVTQKPPVLLPNGGKPVRNMNEEISAYLNTLATKKAFLRHARVPIWVGYVGKSILTTIQSLVGMDMVEQANDGKFYAALDRAFHKIDMQAVKSLFSKPWDQGQVLNLEAKAKQEGELWHKLRMGETQSILMIVIVILALCVLLGVIMYFAR